MTAGSCLEGVRDRQRDEDGDGGTEGQMDRCRDGWRDEEYWVSEDGQTDEVRPEEGKGVGGLGGCHPFAVLCQASAGSKSTPTPSQGIQAAGRPRCPPPGVPRHLGTPASQALVSPSAVPTLDLLGSCPSGMIPGDVGVLGGGGQKELIAISWPLTPPGVLTHGLQQPKMVHPRVTSPFGAVSPRDPSNLGSLPLWGGQPWENIPPWGG